MLDEPGRRSPGSKGLRDCTDAGGGRHRQSAGVEGGLARASPVRGLVFRPNLQAGCRYPRAYGAKRSESEPVGA